MSNGVIHTAFNYDFPKLVGNCEIDRHAIETLGSVLAGSNRPLLVISGTGLLTRPPSGPKKVRPIPAPGSPTSRWKKQQLR
jgi:hypothetical protein